MVPEMKKIAVFSLLLLLPMTGFSKNYESTFIEEMPEVSVSEADPQILEWTKDGLNLLAYGSLSIPQPVIILSDKNKYKGMQPDQQKLFADRLQSLFTSRFGDIIDIVDTPQADTLVMNIALTELIMKKKRGFMSFTPVGAMAHAATANNKIKNIEEIAKKVLMKDANLEVEFVDAGTGELVGVRIIQISGKEKGREEESWAALRAEITTVVDRFYSNYEAALANAAPAE
jgi:hypothetical protein